MDHMTCNSKPAADLDSFDFLELVVHDVHGVTKGRMVTKSHLSKVLSTGEGLVSDLCYVGIQGEKPICGDDSHSSGNTYLKPIPDTAVVSLRSANGSHRVGQVMCYMEFPNGKLDTSEPRTCAKLQLDKLKEMGFFLKSSHEIEFVLRKLNPPKSEGGYIQHSCNINVLNNVQEMMIDMMKEMKESGADLNTLMAEMDQDQFEVTAVLASGLGAADTTARFKNWSKIFFQKRGYKAMFMTCVRAKGAYSCLHWNHSIWTNKEENALVDKSSKGKLSEIGRQWLAGLLAHAPALTALCNPTVNCYRRKCDIFQPFFSSSWAYDDRTVAFRVKAESSGNFYVENRLPGSIANPYIVVAASVAAGMDGIRRKLDLPPAKEKKALPSSLEAALLALEKDDVIVQALGPLVEKFIYMKRRYELNKFKALENSSDELIFEKELEIYSHM